LVFLKFLKSSKTAPAKSYERFKICSLIFDFMFSTDSFLQQVLKFQNKWCEIGHKIFKNFGHQPGVNNFKARVRVPTTGRDKMIHHKNDTSRKRK